MATIDDIKRAFTGKIDSYEAYMLACTAAGIQTDWLLHQGLFSRGFPAWQVGNDHSVNLFSQPVKNTWHHMRELLRAYSGVYSERPQVLSDVVTHLKLSGYHINVSREDPMMVIHTPGPEDGRRDRQVRTTLGKLLRRICPQLLDDDIQAIESTFRSEQDPRFEVARSIEEIYRVYTTMGGDSGCMRHKGEYWGLPEGVHPSNVYAAPGFGVAYTQDDAGIIKSRCVIWDNPADPADKRYVRLYGDAVLGRKLTAAGYVCKNLTGAKLLAVPVGGRVANPEFDSDEREYDDNDDYTGFDTRGEPEFLVGESSGDRYVMPYLDGPGQAQSDGIGDYVVKYTGENYLTVVDQKVAAKIKAAGGFAVYAKETSGSIEVKDTDPAAFVFTCPLSGNAVNRLTDSVQTGYYLKDGAVVQVLLSATAAMSSIRAYNPAMNSWFDLAVTQEDQAARSYEQRGVTYFKDTATLAALDVTLLSPRLGYGDDCYCARDDAKPAIRFADVGKADAEILNARAKDCYLLVTSDDERVYVHSSELKEIKRSKKYVAVSPAGSIKALCAVDHTGLVTLANGRKVVGGVHEVTQLFDGSWTYTRNTKTVVFFGNMLRVLKSFSGRLKLTDTQIKERLFEPFAASHKGIALAELRDRLGSLFRSRVHSGYWGFHCHVDSAGVFVINRYGVGSTSFTQQVQAGKRITAMDDVALESTFWPGVVEVARYWARVVLVLDTLLQEATAPQQPAPVTVSDIDAPLADTRFAAAA